MEKCVFLIDSGYLSFISKFLGKGKHLKFKIEKFVLNISKRLDLDCEEIYFYVAPPYQSSNPSEEENKRKANYDKFISKLKEIKTPIIKIREGRCQKIKDEFSQKGVDTLITMDLLKIAQKNNIKDILLLTADTDFVPIIDDIRLNNKIKITLLYFTDKRRKSPFSLSNHLWKSCDRKILIKSSDFN